MKKLITGMLACVVALSACHHHDHNHQHGHDHDHDHAHQHEEHAHSHDAHAHSHDAHAHAQGEACTAPHGAIEMSEEEARMAGVEVTAVQPDSFFQTLEVSGKIQFAQNDETVVTANTAGVIHFAKTFTDGTAVQQGSLIGRISSDKMAGGDPIRKNEVSYAIAKDNLERMKRLLKDQLVTQDEYNAALEQYENTRIAHEATQAAKGKDGHQLKSPLSGYVLETLVRNGDYVEPGTPIIRLVRNNKMMLTADVPLRHQAIINKVKAATFVAEGNTAVFCTDSLGGKQLPTPSSVSAQSAFLTLRWEMNRAAGLWSGSYAKVYLHGEPLSNVLCVPVTALTDEAGVFYVYLRHDASHYVKQRVTLGASDGQRVQILSGLHAGDQVVTQGAVCVRQAGMSKVMGGHGHSH